MDSTLHWPTPERGGAALSFDVAMATLRATLAASPIDPANTTDLPALIARLARAGKAQGMKPEAVLVAFRKAWEHDDTHWMFRSGSRGHRAIGVLLNAYFAKQ